MTLGIHFYGSLKGHGSLRTVSYYEILNGALCLKCQFCCHLIEIYSNISSSKYLEIGWARLRKQQRCKLKIDNPCIL